MFGAAILLVTLLAACTMLTDQQRLQQIMAINDTRTQVAALKQFIRDYPQSKSINRAYQAIFRGETALGHGPEAIRAAAEFLALLPPDARMSDYNGIAWTLAEKGLELDSARTYAERAVQLARQTNSSRLNLILDTYAFTLFKTGDAASAEQIQLQAISGNEEDGGFLSRLAEYQYANHKSLAALKTMARAILYKAEAPALRLFNEWLNAEKPQGDSRQLLARQIVDQTIAEFLKQDSSATARSQASMLLARTGTDLVRAEKWALAAVSEADSNASPDERIMLNTNLALVYQSKDEYAKMIQILEPWQSLATPYDQEYWTALARAYQKSGQKDKSYQAVLSGLVLFPDEQLQAIAEDQGYTAAEIDEGCRRYKIELQTYNPGRLKIERPLTGRAVLVELFTGAECNPCAGADKALDLLAEYYPRQAVAILEYHLHIPGADPLTNTSSGARYEFYGENFGTPTVIFNGVTEFTGGGPDIVKKALFSRYRLAVEKYFVPAAPVSLDFKTDHRESLIHVRAEVGGFNDTGNEAVKLYIALLEKSVNYTGGNGISRQAFVVRSIVNQGRGIPLKLEEGKGTVEQTIDLQEVQRELAKYLDNFAQNPPARYKNFPGWNVRADKVDPHRLAVAVWVQNDVSKEVYQAGYQDIN
jgi:hypothetical protein